MQKNLSNCVLWNWTKTGFRFSTCYQLCLTQSLGLFYAVAVYCQTTLTSCFKLYESPVYVAIQLKCIFPCCKSCKNKGKSKAHVRFDPVWKDTCPMQFALWRRVANSFPCFLSLTSSLLGKQWASVQPLTRNVPRAVDLLRSSHYAALSDMLIAPRVLLGNIKGRSLGPVSNITRSVSEIHCVLYR